MKVVIAIDSFKGSLSSLEAGEAAKRGILKSNPQAQVEVRPLADGGEGTVEALVQGMGGRTCKVTVTGPLGNPVEAEYGIVGENTAVRNPLYTTTYGVGEMIKDAIEKGCRRFLVGIGGSATNDGGVGMLQALGYEFLDQEGKEVPLGARGLEYLASIRDEKVHPQLRECEFRVACDVVNPLCGPQGSSAIYGPQKGADAEMIDKMDKWLGAYAKLAAETFPKADPETPGTGAAGGLGFAFLTFTNSVLESGIQIILEETRLEDYVKDADVVVTGEGRLDGQTAMGKAPVGVASLAKRYGKTVVAFAGSVTRDAVKCNEKGIDAFFPVIRGISTLEEAMDPETAAQNLADTAEQVFRLFNLKQGI